jgi:hypothetical protein
MVMSAATRTHASSALPRTQKEFIPSWAWRTSGVLFAITVFVVVSAWLYLPWWELAFRSDGSPLSWLSSSLLFACAILALQNGVQGRLGPALALWLTAAMLAMALDEQFMFHEYWKYHCHDWTGWCGRAAPGHIDPLGDLPMMLVGVFGIGTLIVFYRKINYTVARALLVAAVGTGVIFALGTHFLHAANLLPAWVGRFEEMFEVYAEALFLCALVELPPHSPRVHSS